MRSCHRRRGIDSEVEDIIFGETGLLASAKAGMVLAVASTIGRHYEIHAERAGPDVIVSIPMCRGEQAALDGDLLLLGGGDKEAFDACAPRSKPSPTTYIILAIWAPDRSVR